MKKLFAIVTAFCMTATILPIRSDTGSNHPWIEANAAGNLSSYEEVLQTIYDSRSYDGAYFELMPGCNVQDNKFSLCNVDFDGQDELLVCWTEASANDRVEAIFDKNTSGRVYLKGETSPHDDLSWLSASQEYLKYYWSSGVVFGTWINNQTEVTSFWPFGVQKINTLTGKYEFYASVYAGYSSNSSIEYYVSAASGSSKTLNSTQYETWYQGYTKNYQRIKPQYMAMTLANIQAVNDNHEPTTETVKPTQASTAPTKPPTEPLLETVNALPLGDVNDDKYINASDAAQILIAAASIGAGGSYGLTDAQTTAADVNFDKTVNASDAATVLIYAAYVGAGGTMSLPDYLASPPQPATDPTEPPTEKLTEAPTQAPTQPPTEKPTQAPTQPPTEAKPKITSSKITYSLSSGDGGTYYLNVSGTYSYYTYEVEILEAAEAQREYKEFGNYWMDYYSDGKSSSSKLKLLSASIPLYVLVIITPYNSKGVVGPTVNCWYRD